MSNNQPSTPNSYLFTIPTTSTTSLSHSRHLELVSSNKKLSSTQYSQSNTNNKFISLPPLDISMFSTTYNTTLKRINQIKPKPKIIIPNKIIINNNNINTNNNNINTNININTNNDNINTIIKIPKLIQENYTHQITSNQKQSIHYHSINNTSFFNWKKYAPLCGFQTKTGQNGCLCGNPCKFQKQWNKHYKDTDFKIYQQLLNQPIKQNQEIQIQKDILRTHPQCLTFSNNPRFQQMLRQVLRQYSVYDPQVGYVQGMNLIVGAILYHMKNSQLTFWAFVDLMDQQQLRMIYLPGFQFLTLHQNKIKSILDKKVNDLVVRMNQLGIIPESFMNGWILSLMGVCIPLEYMHLLIQKFRKLGWNYIYQLIITYLLFLKESLLHADDDSEFLESLNYKNSRQYGIVWEELIQNAHNFPLYSESLTNSTTSI